jgi:hypothetical protein
MRAGAARRLGGLAPNPKVNIPRQLVWVDLWLLDICVEHNVRVARMKLAVLGLGPRDDLELFNPPARAQSCSPTVQCTLTNSPSSAPDLQAHLDTRIRPLWLTVGRRLLDLLFNLRAVQVCSKEVVPLAAHVETGLLRRVYTHRNQTRPCWCPASPADDLSAWRRYEKKTTSAGEQRIQARITHQHAAGDHHPVHLACGIKGIFCWRKSGSP